MLIAPVTGTAVAGVAAGNGRNSGGRYRGTAPDAELIIVKLGNPGGVGFPRTAELMQAVDYIVQKAEMLQMPVSVNISFGNTYALITEHHCRSVFWMRLRRSAGLNQCGNRK